MFKGGEIHLAVETKELQSVSADSRVILEYLCALADILRQLRDAHLVLAASAHVVVELHSMRHIGLRMRHARYQEGTTLLQS